MCDRILYPSVIVHSCLGLVEYVRGALWNGHRAPVIIWRVELGTSEKPDCHSQTAGHSKVCALRTIENCQGFFFRFKNCLWSSFQETTVTTEQKRPFRHIGQSGDQQPIRASLPYERTRVFRILAAPKLGREQKNRRGTGLVFAPDWPAENISLRWLTEKRDERGDLRYRKQLLEIN